MTEITDGSAEDSRFRWVDSRVRCDVVFLYGELCDVVKRDVGELNNLLGSCAGGETELRSLFAVSRPNHPIFVFKKTGSRSCVDVTFKDGRSRSLEFRLDGRTAGAGRTIFIGFGERDAKPFFDVSARWDSEKGVRQIFIGREKVHLWQISERALSRAFFECE